MDKTNYLKAILTEQGDITLYRNSAYFHQTLDTFIEMIPIFVDGLREHSRIYDNKIKNLEKQLRGIPEGYPDWK